MKMNRILGLVLALMLIAVPAFAGGTATAHDTAMINLNYMDSGGNLTTGWGASGHMDGTRLGDAIGQKFFIFPAFAVATGELNGQIISDGYSFQGSNFAGAGAFSHVTGNAWELALAGLKNPHTSTSVMIEGWVNQGNGAGVQSGPFYGGSTSFAIGGNESGAAFINTDSNIGGLLSFSATCGEAFTKGETRVYALTQGVPGVWGESTAWGFTKNSGFGNAGVAGIGNMTTATYLYNPITSNLASTYTTSSFGYDNPNKGWGIAGGYGQSTINAIPNGVKGSAHSISYAVSK